VKQLTRIVYFEDEAGEELVDAKKTRDMRAKGDKVDRGIGNRIEHS